MTRQIINVGTADKGNGDPIRTAFIKTNANFAELYNILSNNTGGSIITTDVIGSVFADDSTLLVDGVNGNIPYSVLSGAPTIPAAQVQSNWTAASGMGVILNKPTFATVATSGAYADLTGKPTIPTGFDRLTSSGDEVVLFGGADPYTLFPAITGGDRLSIQGAEVLSISGNLALTSQGDLNIISNGSGTVPGGSKNWTFGDDGSLTIPGDIRSEKEINLDINLADSTLRRWRFGEDGDLRFPNGATIQNTAGNAVAFGNGAGQTNQNDYAVAIGQLAGNDTQGVAAVAIGSDAGQTSQGNSAVAIGTVAGLNTQGISAVAIGGGAGQSTQGISAVAIGGAAGQISQGQYAVALGYGAGHNSQANSSIVINATGALLENTTASSLVVKPVRGVAGASLPAGFKPVAYNPTTGEFIYYDA